MLKRKRPVLSDDEKYRLIQFEKLTTDKGLTRTQLAKYLNIDLSEVMDYLRGMVPVSVELLEKLSAIQKEPVCKYDQNDKVKNVTEDDLEFLGNVLGIRKKLSLDSVIELIKTNHKTLNNTDTIVDEHDIQFLSLIHSKLENLSLDTLRVVLKNKKITT